MDYKNKAYEGCLKYQRNQINLMLAGGLKITHQHTYTYLKGINRSKISKKYTKYAYVFIQCFLYQWPALFQVSLPVFGEQSCKTALLQESSGVVLFGKSWFLPTIWNSKKFWFIYRKKCTHQILIYFWTFICMHLEASSTFLALPLPMLFKKILTWRNVYWWERERERQTDMDQLPPIRPDRGLNLQPRYVHSQGIKSSTLRFIRWPTEPKQSGLYHDFFFK